MTKLILIRHATSTYNEQGLWCGWDNPHLSEKGFAEARKAGEVLQGVSIDKIYLPSFYRTQETLQEILKVLGNPHIETIIAEELKERDYGDFTAKNKWQIKQEVGDEEFQKIRRGWDYPIPHGESLKQVYEREIPYLTTHILPDILEEKSVLIISSGNALRAISKYIEQISDSAIGDVEFGLGEVWEYNFNDKGELIKKEIKAVNPQKGKI